MNQIWVALGKNQSLKAIFLRAGGNTELNICNFVGFLLVKNFLQHIALLDFKNIVLGYVGALHTAFNRHPSLGIEITGRENSLGSLFFFVC
jgi:hypothetical protein